MSEAAVTAQVAGTPQAPVQGEQAPSTPVENVQPTQSKAEELNLKMQYEKRMHQERMKYKQQMQRMQQQLQNQMRQQQQQLEQRYGKYAQFDQINNPIDLLKAKGWSYEDASQYVLNDNKPTADQQVKSIQQQFEEYKQQQAQKEEQQRQAAIKAQEKHVQETLQEYRNSIDTFVDANKDKYELCALFNGQDLIYNTVQEYYERTNKIMSNEEAAQAGEDYLMEEVRKVQNTNKGKSLFGAQVDQAAEDMKARVSGEIPPGYAQRPPARTISNQMASHSSPSVVGHKGEMDRLARAAAAYDRAKSK